MIALGATKKYRSTHEHDGISFKSMFILYRKKGDRYIDKEGRKEEKREGERREERNTFKGNIKLTLWHLEGFPGSSADKEFACTAGYFGSIPGLGRFTVEGIGYPLQYSRASLVAQLVKNLPSMWDTWVLSLSWEVPLEKETASYPLQYGRH